MGNTRYDPDVNVRVLVNVNVHVNVNVPETGVTWEPKGIAWKAWQ